MTKNVKIPISRKIRIGEELMNMRYTSGSIQGFINIFEGKIDELNKDSNEFEIKNGLKAILLCTMVREKFGHIVRNIENDNKLVYDNLIQKLLQCESSKSDSIEHVTETVCQVKNVRCFKCKKIGHYANVCQFKNDVDRNSSFNSRSISRLPMFIDGTKNVKRVTAVFNGSIVNRNSNFILDSGATNHCCNDKNLFIDLHEDSTVLTTIGGEKYVLNFSGTIVFEFGNYGRVKIKNVFYTPDFEINVLSISLLQSQGYSVNFSANSLSCFISRENVNLIEINQFNGLYYVNYCVPKNKVQFSNFDRFNHSQNCVSKPRDLKIDMAIKHRFEHLIIDLMGPMKVASVGGAKYLMIIIDLFSRFIFVEFFQVNSESTDKLIYFIENFQKRYGSKVKALCIGTECQDEKLFNYCDANLIDVHFYSDCSIQNGIFDETKMLILNDIHTVLSVSNMNFSFWGEAARYVAYIFNQCVNEDGKSPFEKFFGKKPVDKVLYPFGCAVKVGENSKKLLFLGFGVGSNRYRFIDPPNTEIIYLSNVSFLNEYYFQDTSSNDSGIELFSSLDDENIESSSNDNELIDSTLSSNNNSTLIDLNVSNSSSSSVNTNSIVPNGSESSSSSSNVQSSSTNSSSNDDSVKSTSVRRSERSNIGVQPDRFKYDSNFKVVNHH